MTDREAEKKERELIPCRWLAKELNRARGTDYKVIASSEEPADVLFTSASRKHPEIPAQVISIPLDWRHRDDNQSVQRIRRYLKDALLKRGLKHCSVGIILTGPDELKGLNNSLLEQLIKLVEEESRKGNRKLNYEEIGAYFPELARYVHYIIITHYEGIEDVDVDIPSHASALPSDGRWIEEGIHKKAQKYGGAESVKNLMLVIDVAGVVDDEQIDAFRAANPEEGLPFFEIWIVAFHGMVCLKKAR